MATTSSSVSSSSPTGSPQFRRPADPSSAAVSSAASSRFSPPPSPTSARLNSAIPPRDLAQEKYDQARVFLREKQPEQARTLFLELIHEFSADESHLIESADCYIGVGFSHPHGSNERIQSALQAKSLLDPVFLKTLESNTSDKATVRTFQTLRILYGELTHLVLLDRTEFHNDVKATIEECSRRIPVLTNFYEKFAQVESLIDTQPELARGIVNEAMATLVGDQAEIILARAMGNLKRAQTYPEGDERLQFAFEARVQTFTAYERKEEISAKKPALRCFYVLFEALSRLIPTDYDSHAQIMQKLVEVQAQLANAHSKAEKTTPPDHKVTPGPVLGSEDDYWKPLRLFIAFGIAAAVIAGAVFLGRRLITKLN